MKDFTDYLDHIQKHGDRIALVDDASGLQLSFTQLVQDARVVAKNLARMGVQAGDRIVLYKLKNIDWVRLFLGALEARIVVVPLDARVSDDLVHAMVASTKPKLIVCDEAFKSSSKVITASQLISIGTAKLPKQKQDVLTGPVLAEILLTSGTWSQPKGVTLTQQNLLSNLAATYKMYRLKRSEVFLSLLPLSHAYEQMCGLLLPLLVGAKVVYISEITGDALKNAFKKHRITIVVAVPRILELLKKGILRKLPAERHDKFMNITKKLRHAPQPVRRLVLNKVHKGLSPSLKRLVIGGAPYDPALDHFFSGLGYKTLIGYGLSETAPIISICTRPKARVKGSVGKVLDGISVQINEDNELLIQGPNTFYGYWPAVRESGWFNTGDQGYVTNKGHIVLTGRTKNMVIYSNGDKLFLEDIEKLFDAVPGIEESCVLYMQEEFNGVLDIVIHAKEAIDFEQIKKDVASALPPVARLGTITNSYPEALPRTHTLKLNRKKAWDLYAKSSAKV